MSRIDRTHEQARIHRSPPTLLAFTASWVHGWRASSRSSTRPSRTGGAATGPPTPAATTPPWTSRTRSRGGGGWSRRCAHRSAPPRRPRRARARGTGGTCPWRSWRARWGSRRTGGCGWRCPRPGASASSPASAPAPRDVRVGVPIYRTLVSV